MEENLMEFDDFKRSEPDHVTLKKAGLNGEDVTLKKTEINGVVVYAASCKIEGWGERSLKKQ
ncbi:MAG: hypothetical protein FP814_12230 [Desulfobacterium sp.]|nr:hypothetical protein [Desulfobacterium sp.]